jgi:hypothetical protein
MLGGMPDIPFGYPTGAVRSHGRWLRCALIRVTHVQIHTERITGITELIEQFVDSVEVSGLNLISDIAVRCVYAQPVFFLTRLQRPDPRIVLLRR